MKTTFNKSGWWTSPGGMFHVAQGCHVATDRMRSDGVLTLAFSTPVEIVGGVFLAENANCAKVISMWLPESDEDTASQIIGNKRNKVAVWETAEIHPLTVALRDVTELKVRIDEVHGDHYCGINWIRLYGFV